MGVKEKDLFGADWAMPAASVVALEAAFESRRTGADPDFFCAHCASGAVSTTPKVALKGPSEAVGATLVASVGAPGGVAKEVARLAPESETCCKFWPAGWVE